MNDATGAMSRAGEAAVIVCSLGPEHLAEAVRLVYGDFIEAVQVPPINQSECPAPPCPAMGRAAGLAIGAVQGTAGVIAVELLTGLVVAVRRLAELEDRPPAQVVRDLVASLEGI